MANKSVEAFKQRLARVPKLVRAKVEAAIAQNANEWVNTARRLAPRDPPGGTPLVDSIRSYPTETGGQVVRAGGVPATTTHGPNGPFDYAVGQEFGTVNHPAQPFFWVSYRLLKKRFNSRRKRALTTAIKEINNNGR